MDKEKNYRLCYVSGGYAYFTTAPLEEVWGDDWDDIPYENQAGEPVISDDEGLLIFHYTNDGNLKTPAEAANGNSAFSVRMINRCLVPWLSNAWSNLGPTFYPVINIFAGATLANFFFIANRLGMDVSLYEASWIDENRSSRSSLTQIIS